MEWLKKKNQTFWLRNSVKEHSLRTDCGINNALLVSQSEFGKFHVHANNICKLYIYMLVIEGKFP